MSSFLEAILSLDSVSGSHNETPAGLAGGYGG